MYKVISGYSVDKNRTVYIVMNNFKQVKQYRYKFMAKIDAFIRGVNYGRE